MTKLYRHYNTEGQLLYVGISLSAVTRLSAHVRSSAWADQIATVTIDTFATRDEALAAEKYAIKTENPLHNKVHAKTAVGDKLVAVRFPADLYEQLPEPSLVRGRGRNAFITEAVREKLEREGSAVDWASRDLSETQD